MNAAIVTLVVLLGLFMAGTVFIAVFQDSLGWGWWWTLPLGGVFVVLVLGFRLLVQHLDEATKRRDAEMDAREREGSRGE